MKEKDYKKFFRGFLLSLCITMFLIITFFVIKYDNLVIDQSIYNFFYNFSSSQATVIFLIITFLASKEFIILMCLIFILISLIKRKYQTSFLIILNIVISLLLNQTFKAIIRRERPFELMIVNESGYSFPSGHSMTALIFYGYFIYLTWESNLKKISKIFITILNIILILLVGISRIYLGVHYPTDVIGAYFLGLFYLILYINITNNYIKRKIK